MKQCSKCKQIKLLDDFQRRTRNRDGYTNICKLCKRKYDNEYYARTPGRKDQITQNRRAALDQVNEYIVNYLSEHPCIDCGESDIVVLEFDHRGSKAANVADIRRNGVESVKKEISKCDVRCANCHRRKTAATHGSYRIAFFA